mgnify:CR=1 FL=1
MRLLQRLLDSLSAAQQALEDQKTDIGWGHQIRSYVLQPYQMVKDLRTGVEKGNPTAVLDGDIDDFLAASLAAKAGSRAPRKPRIEVLQPGPAGTPAFLKCPACGLFSRDGRSSTNPTCTAS